MPGFKSANVIVAFVLYMFSALSEALPIVADTTFQQQQQQTPNCADAYALLARMFDVSQLQMYQSIYGAVVWLTAGCIIGILITYCIFQDRIESEGQKGGEAESFADLPAYDCVSQKC
ncbi:hypothetical protein GGI11_000282 [Coemansia sp. RSA 2049]|nr:hypothetical protein H4217_006712 [Coemansia sp. RSA 1939]KAJ2525152.1 hypothetical protein GGI11_000282 [Coemansia sp. RSA 2049]KAJ2616807.1 hypothetical protein EV177_000869 [Coemansia sp. RSA 1804]